MILFHYTCGHAVKKIEASARPGDTGLLVGAEHSMLPQAPPIIWLTDLLIEGEPAEYERRALGMPLDQRAIGQGCDRFEYRIAVAVAASAVHRWPRWARRNLIAAQYTAVEANVPGSLVAHWWCSFARTLPVLTIDPTRVSFKYTPNVEGP